MSIASTWYFRSQKRKAAAAANIASIAAEPQQPDIGTEFSNPAFRESEPIPAHLDPRLHHVHDNRPITPIAESNYIYFGGPSCQYDVIYTDVARDDVNKGASTSGE